MGFDPIAAMRHALICCVTSGLVILLQFPSLGASIPEPLAGDTADHAFYVSICYLRQKEGNIELDYRMFKDDLELALKRLPDSADDYCAKIFRYLSSRVRIVLNGQRLDLSPGVCRSEGEGYLESVSATMHVPLKGPTNGKLEIETSVLTEIYDDQINMVHVLWHNLKRSRNLDRRRQRFELEVP